MTFKDYYKILGIDNIKVTNEEIKTAYRNQAKKFHPDINKESTGEIIKDINEAYKILSNPQTKKKYDKLWITLYVFLFFNYILIFSFSFSEISNIINSGDFKSFANKLFGNILVNF